MQLFEEDRRNHESVEELINEFITKSSIVKFRAEEPRTSDDVEVDVKIDDIIDEVLFDDGGETLYYC